MTLGHPCCNEHDCKIPLNKVDDEYCPEHEYKRSLCCVISCGNPRESGFRTCGAPSHRGEEKYRKERRRKKKKVKVIGADEEESGGPDSKRKKNKREGVKGVFSRRWTHNEQLMVRPCGMVIGRATFYSSESMIGVKARILLFGVDMGLTQQVAIYQECLSFAISRNRTVLHILRQRLWFASAHRRSRQTSTEEGRVGRRRIPLYGSHGISCRLWGILQSTRLSHIEEERRKLALQFIGSRTGECVVWQVPEQGQRDERRPVHHLSFTYSFGFDATNSYNFYLDEVLNIRNAIREEELRKRGLAPRILTTDELLAKNTPANTKST